MSFEPNRLEWLLAQLIEAITRNTEVLRAMTTTLQQADTDIVAAVTQANTLEAQSIQQIQDLIAAAKANGQSQVDIDDIEAAAQSLATSNASTAVALAAANPPAGSSDTSDSSASSDGSAAADPSTGDTGTTGS
jgi:hypothetical protein